MYYTRSKDGTLRLQEAYIDDLTGRRRQVTVVVKGTSNKAKHEAQERLQKLLSQKIQPVNNRLSDLIKAYLAEELVSVKRSTYDRNHGSLNSMIRIVGDISLDKLTAGIIRSALLKANVKPITANEYIARWKACLRWGYANDYLPDLKVVDKLQRFTEPTTRKERTANKYLETNEIKLILEAMQNDRERLFTKFLILTGCRIGEAIALNNEDISDGYIHITKTYDLHHDILTSPKTNTSIRDIYIQPELNKLLQEVKALMKRQKIRFGYKSTSYLFTSQYGDRLSYDVYRKDLRKISNLAIGREITPHALRHTTVSILAAQGLTIDEIAARVGHGANSKVTREVYLHVTKELQKKRNAKMDAVKMFG